MTTKEAMSARHMVRKYTGRKIPRDVEEQLMERIYQNNEKYGLSMRLVTDNADALNIFIKLVLARGVRNYIVLAGKNSGDVDEKLGYCGADVMLFAQTLGLNSWWVGGTFSRSGVKKKAGVADNERIAGIIAIGYGTTQGIPHKSKKAEEISSYAGTAPDWFQEGVGAVLLAPTALNKQAFNIRGEGNKVSMTCDNGIYTGIDLGIGRYHFEAGAGKNHFEWV